ncbi:F-box protein [Rhynchospora pubera]|uniref:F-box family protein n=1 Tax=Rhynchospora pubera TaxID=906938 RepID=A0AAV8GVJ5_9POAL|nr:F-box family protein [Rhynchospora pubera]KAJ4806477.1 F-box protein [Rhynchospora pubera]
MAPPSKKPRKELPEHLIHQLLLPRLPFKCLRRLMCTSTNLHSLINADAQFAADQARCATISRSSFVYMSKSGLSFFPDPSLVGVPDPSLNFLNPTPSSEIKLICSTNGILLLYGEFRGLKSLCVCNPATQEKAFVPDKNMTKDYGRWEMGLCYDPWESPDRYTIVNPIFHCKGDGKDYHFDVFSSDTGEWTLSSWSVYVDTEYVPCKPICAKGVIYWECGIYLLWYDTRKDLAGSITLPLMDGLTNFGVCANDLTCCHTCAGGIEVWRLIGGSCWEGCMG